jgi:hypothetical protein
MPFTVLGARDADEIDREKNCLDGIFLPQG